MSPELLAVVFGGPGVVGLFVAILAFLQNRRTLKASQPKSDAEKMKVEIDSVRELLAESRLVREADKTDYAYRIAELKAQLLEQKKECNDRFDDIISRFEKYLKENAVAKPHWWPRRHHDG